MSSIEEVVDEEGELMKWRRTIEFIQDEKLTWDHKRRQWSRI